MMTGGRQTLQQFSGRKQKVFAQTKQERNVLINIEDRDYGEKKE